MTFKENDVVRVSCAVGEKIPAGSEGTIVYVLDSDNFLVEFFRDEESLGDVQVAAKQLEAVAS